MSVEPDNLVLQLLRDMRADMAEMRAEVKADMHSLRADVAADFIDVRREITGSCKELSQQIVELRRAVVTDHTAVVGHGLTIAEHDERLQRLERRLDPPPPETH